MGHEELLVLARAIATEAHAGQTDKAGAPYIGHPVRVADLVRGHGGSSVQEAAALLHDVVEDTSLTFDDMANRGVPDDVVGMVDALTKREGEDYLDAVRRAQRYPGAELLKRCDLADNLDPIRLARLDATLADRLRAKYTTALALLDTPLASN